MVDHRCGKLLTAAKGAAGLTTGREDTRTRCVYGELRYALVPKVRVAVH
jgi:hypothetical protein